MDAIDALLGHLKATPTVMLGLLSKNAAVPSSGIRHLPSGQMLVTELELALTKEEKTQGMLEREPPPEGFGLLMPGVDSIHMIGMIFPLDVLFLDEDMAVVGVEELLLAGTKNAACPGAAYVLEMTAGTLDRIPVEVGDELEMISEEGKSAEASPRRAQLDLTKLSALAEEFAPGIPTSRSKKPLPILEGPSTWDFTLHQHEAERAGKHFDLRLSDGEHAYSWAVRKGLPEPGKKHLAVVQPTHTPEYMTFKGPILEGYGKGTVSIADSGNVRILESKPDKMRFVLTNKKDPEEFMLFRPKNFGKPEDWLLYNITPTREKKWEIPSEKPTYKDAKPDQLSNFLSPEYLLSAKIDGAHTITEFPKKDPLSKVRHPQVFSYRPSARSDRLINHTFKIPGVDELQTPKELEGTIVRGELYGINRETGRVVPAHQLSGILNATTANSLQKQTEEGVELRNALFDVIKYKGRDVRDLPYSEKLKMLEEIDKATPRMFTVPDYAISPEEKQQLFEKIKSGTHPATAEGVIAWNLQGNGPPVKLKLRPDYDVYVRDVYEGSGKFEGSHAGGFEYSLTPRGKIVGRVGTGLTEELRQDMWDNPQSYKGRVAKVTAQGQHSSGALRAPAFTGQWHLDKGKILKSAEALGEDVAKSLQQAQWTSMKNAREHARKHAVEMGLTRKEYLERARELATSREGLIPVPHKRVGTEAYFHPHTREYLVLQNNTGNIMSYFQKNRKPWVTWTR